MNNEKEKAQRLWHYLKIQDEHLLIRTTNPDDNSERLMTVCEDGEGGLRFAYVEIPPEGFNRLISDYGKPFTLVQQRNGDGLFFVPDINEWIRDEEIDR